MHVKKAQLPQGLSYPLKTGDLAFALERAGIIVDCSVDYLGSVGPFTAHFWPPSPEVQHERIYLTVGAVPSAAAEHERKHMADRVLPSFVSWLKAIIAQSPNSPICREKQIFLGADVR
jgi:hypothetical protein